MKNFIKLPAIVLGLLLLLTGTSQKVMAQDEDISLQSFYDELSPYGTWIQDSQYGYVWRPDADQGDFRPYYTNGRWAMTEYGNTWVSNYDWGWAPFHYGRWVYNRYNQWVWIPDTVWGPAWVSWRSGGGYYGWAPMGPGMNINVNINIPSLWWVFVPQRNIYYDSFPRYYSRRNVTIINNTTIINNVYSRNRYSYYTGPRADEIRRETRQDVRVYSINRTSRPTRSTLSGDRVDIYSPRPGRVSANTTPVPRNVVRGEGYATARPDRTGEANSGNRPSRVDQGGNRPVNPSNRPDRIDRTDNRRGEGMTTPQTRPQNRGTGTVNEPQNRPQRTERPQRQEQPAQQQPESRPQQPATRPERQPQPRNEQPQRQESRPAPQRSQPTEQNRPSRTSEGRGNSGGNRESAPAPARPTRASRG